MATSANLRRLPILAAIHALPEQLLVLQPTPFCNLRCRYCYLPDRDVRSTMSDAVLQAVLRSIETSALFGPRLTVVWHAGEPLAAGKPFFARALAATQRVNDMGVKKVSHSVQTNGLLLDDAWLDLFEAHRVKLGLSIDGSARLHDLHRKSRAGGGTHAHAVRAAERLNSRRYPFSVIMVITREALDLADEIFDFFASIAVPFVGLNVEEMESAHRGTSLRGSDVDEKLRRFYLRLLERQEASGRAVRFREFEPFLRLLDDPAACDPNAVYSRSSVTVPFSVVSVDVNGDFSTFCPELLGSRAPEFNDFRMGNVLTGDFDALPDSPVFQAVEGAIAAGVAECERRCHYWRFCGGGSPGNKFFEQGRLDVAETHYCRQHKQLVVDAVLDFVERSSALRKASC